MERAYSLLTEKSVEDGPEYVTIRGIASTPSTDRMGDIVEPMGAKFALPMKLLLQHDHGMPVGNLTYAEPTPNGIPFEARLPIIKEPGRLKDRVDEAIHSLKYDLISAVSVGFKAVADKVERLKTGGLRFKEWEWIELSLVTIPANSEAVITAIKSVDQAALASAGIPREVVTPAADVSGHTKRGPVFLTKRRAHQPVTITRKQP
jgi:HK97 family phage prohead protease